MTTKLKSAPFALALAGALAVALLASAPLFAQPEARAGGATSERAHRGIGPLAGAWRMTRLESGTDGNLERVPYSGQIVFTKAGTMSVQAMNPDTDAPDTPYTINGYEAFYGDVTVDDTARRGGRDGTRRGTLAVTVESAAVRNLIGQRLTRNFTVTGDKLVLTPSDPTEGWRVTYERR